MQGIALDDVLSRLQALPPKQLQLVAERVARAKAATGRLFTPNIGPQTQAYLSTAQVMLYGGQAGGGKLLALDTLIPTPFGWSTMGDLRVGDQVFDEAGRICSVILKSEIQTETTYRLTFSDGSEIVAGARHPWVTSTRSERFRRWACREERRAARRAVRPKRGTGKRPDLSARNIASAKPLDLPTSGVRTTQEIVDSLTAAGRVNHCVAVAKALQLPEASLPIDPYVLGAWLGDGSTIAGAITGIDEEVFQQVANGGYAVSVRPNSTTRGVLGLQVQLRQLGVLGNKHIPLAYRRASFDQRLALLQGLMDTDGHCDKRGQCEIQLVRAALIDDVAELLASLGIKFQMRKGTAKLCGRTIGPKWRLKFLTEHPAFRLPRKLIRQKRGGFRGTHDVRYIVDATEIDPVSMQCIQVDSPNHMYLCGRTMIATHNTYLELGWGINEADSGIIFRRELSQTDGLEKEGKKLIGGHAGFNGQDLEWTWPSGKTLKLAGIKNPGDWMKHAGRERDYMAFDEGGEFLEEQVASLAAWVRAEPGKRTRILIGSNPPRSSDGIWLLKWFAPWLDPKFPNPAAPGELRWAVHVSFNDQIDVRWVDGPGEYDLDGETYTAKSYTFIPASLSDNPFRNTPEYRAQLQSLPEPLRSQLLYGDFTAGMEDAENQVIPTAWIRAAQERWTEKPPQGVPMCAVGVDASGGGEDPMTIAPRHDGWFAPIVEVPAKDIPMDRKGTYCAGQVLSYRRDDAKVVVDMGGGYGEGIYEHLRQNGIETAAYKGAAMSTGRTASRQMGFVNKRCEVIWRFREALDPDQPGGSHIALPPDPQMVADLTSWTWEPVSHKGGMAVKIEAGDKVREKLGRSPDRGVSVVLSWSSGLKTAHVKGGMHRMQTAPTVITGRGNLARIGGQSYAGQSGSREHG